MKFLLLMLITACSLNVSNAQTYVDEKIKETGWMIMNDGVMGGLSKGYIETKDDIVNFNGNISLENNGGFSWIRTNATTFDLSDASGISIKIKGDGRKYAFTIETPSANSYAYYYIPIKTVEGEWKEFNLKLADFTLNVMGNETNRNLSQYDNIRRIGLILFDKEQGPFSIDIGEIKATRSLNKS